MRKSTPLHAKQLTEQQLEELYENASCILADTRRDLISRYPFVGSIAMNLDLVPTRDIDNPTASTDGTAIYFDIAFLASLQKDERMFVLGHEVWHNVMLHFMRCEDRDRKMFNIATDMEVNSILKQDGFTPPKNCVFPANYGFDNGLAAEDYYELLSKRSKSRPTPGKNNKPNGQKGDNNSNGSDNSDGQNDPADSGNQDGEMNGQFDRHIYKGDAAGNSDKEVYDKYGKVGKDPNFRPMPTESAVEKIREAAVSAAQQIERDSGELPGYLKRVVDALLEPAVDWRDVLTAHVTRVMGEKSNWNHPNRRFAYGGVYLPSHDSEKIRIAVGIDTSGSTNPDLKQFLSELNGLVKSFGNYELHVIQCDTKVQNYELFDESNELDLENHTMAMHGGGGTVLRPIFDYIEENELDVDDVVVFTDGWCEKFTDADAPELPVLWLVSSNGTTDNLAFGEIIKFNGKN